MHEENEKRTTSRRRPLRVWMNGRGGGRKEPRFINGDVPKMHEEQIRNT